MDVHAHDLEHGLKWAHFVMFGSAQFFNQAVAAAVAAPPAAAPTFGSVTAFNQAATAPPVSVSPFGSVSAFTQDVATAVTTPAAAPPAPVTLAPDVPHPAPAGPAAMPSAPAPAVATVSSALNTNTMLYILGGFLVLLMLKKGKR